MQLNEEEKKRRQRENHLLFCLCYFLSVVRYGHSCEEQKRKTSPQHKNTTSSRGALNHSKFFWIHVSKHDFYASHCSVEIKLQIIVAYFLLKCFFQPIMIKVFIIEMLQKAELNSIYCTMTHTYNRYARYFFRKYNHVAFSLHVEHDVFVGVCQDCSTYSEI